MLNGFFGCFACGFLMTAVPKFSQALTASWFEIHFFILVTCFGVWAAYLDNSSLVLSLSALQALIILDLLEKHQLLQLVHRGIQLAERSKSNQQLLRGAARCVRLSVCACAMRKEWAISVLHQ